METHRHPSLPLTRRKEARAAVTWHRVVPLVDRDYVVPEELKEETRPEVLEDRLPL